MTEPSEVNRTEDRPATLEPPQSGNETDKQEETGEEENVPQIPVKQVPMDGICGGY